jgi:hypothetical protein
VASSTFVQAVQYYGLTQKASGGTLAFFVASFTFLAGETQKPRSDIQQAS